MIEQREDLVEPGHGSWTVVAKRDGVMYLNFVTEDGDGAGEVHWSAHQRLMLYDDAHIVRADVIIEEDPL